MTLIRTDQFNITVTLDGEAFGTWDKVSGGQADSDETKYRPGGMAQQISLGGMTTVANLTITKAYDPASDQKRLAKALKKRGTKACAVTCQPLDSDKAPYGEPIVYKGILKSVQPPESDSESNAAAMWSLELSTDSDVSAGAAD